MELAVRTTAVKQAEQQAEEAGRLATRTEQEAVGLRVEVAGVKERARDLLLAQVTFIYI